MNGDISANAHYFQTIAQLTEASSTKSDSPVKLGIAVPAPYLFQAQTALQNTQVLWGAQDISSFDKGARTSEISATMLNEFGCSFCLIGHSERRTNWLESDQQVADKIKQALASSIIPVICVGETEQQRNANETEAVIQRQTSAAIADLTQEQLGKCIFAYEPVWAIGTGNSATPEMAQQVHRFIRQLLPDQHPCPILYGGSVTAENAGVLFEQPDIDGALVGGASLQAQSLYNIAQAN